MSRKKKNRKQKKEIKVKGTLYLDNDVEIEKPKKKKKRKSTRRSEPIPAYLDYWQKFQKQIMIGAGAVFLGISGIICSLSGGVGGSYSNEPVVVSREESRISSGISWPRATYVLEDTLEIDNGSVLEIDAGSTLKFKAGKGIDSKGIIRAVGSENRVITFDAKDKNWKGIRIQGEGSKDSLFEYCVIRNSNGKYGPSFDPREVRLNERALRARRRNIRNTKKDSNGGVFVKDSNATFRNCLFEDNYSKYDGGALCLINFNGVVEDCVFQNNVSGGNYAGALLLRGLCMDSKILRNRFLNNEAPGRGGALATFLNTQNRVEIIGNFFSGNTAGYKQHKHMYCAQNVMFGGFVDWAVGTKKDNVFE